MFRTLCRFLLSASARKKLRKTLGICLEGFKRCLVALPCDGVYSRLGLMLLNKWGCRRVATFICLVLLAQQQKKEHQSSPHISPKWTESEGATLRLSVIIPTYNRADMLPALFDSLQRQTLGVNNFEVIVVNNNSNDTTEEVCASYATSFPNFKVVNEKVQSLLSARHAGWLAASTDILVFCDDDIEAFPTWLATVDLLFSSDPKIGLVGGNNIGKFDASLPIWFAGLWYEEHGVRINGWYSLLEGISEPIVAPNPAFVFGCNYSIRRQALEAVRGFEPDCMQHVLFQGGGETGFASELAKSYKVILHPGASVYHRMPAERLTPAYIWRRGMYFASSSLYAALRAGCLPAKDLIDRQTLLSVGINDFALVKDFNDRYVEAVLLFPAFRDWIVRPSYVGCEAPSADLLAWAKTYVPHSTWHGEASK